MLVEANRSLYKRSGTSKFNIALNILIAIVAVALMIELIFVTTFTGIYVVDISMMPTLNGAPDEHSAGGDYVYIVKSAKPDYGDIVVVTREGDSPLIKRVIAFGGDSVKLVEGKLFIKYAGESEFSEIEENYVDPNRNDPVKPVNNYPTGSSRFPQIGGKFEDDAFIIDEGYVFLLGDNRDYSADSRQNGAFMRKNIYGVVTDWSMKNKKFISSVHKFFSFDIPEFFGKKN